MLVPGLFRGRPGAVAAAVASLTALALTLAGAAGCTRGKGKKCTHDTACDFGLACVFTDVATIDCCAVDTQGQLICDPNDGAVTGRGIAADCELDANGMLKPKLRRLTCLRSTFDQYQVWTHKRMDITDMMGNVIDYDIVLAPIGATLPDDCTCEDGANFYTGDPTVPYDPILAAPPEAILCARTPDSENTSVEPPTVAPLDCPQSDAGIAADTCPPCVAFPEP
ncbi:MAG TPA: hypothetical protein VG389_17900 [Myxococcota bacterium]|jgi:hypothetical protein|nr:hypothetical protein [Myxococcota bacterium]